MVGSITKSQTQQKAAELGLGATLSSSLWLMHLRGFMEGNSKENPFWVITRGSLWDHQWEQTSKNDLVTPREINHKNGTKVQRTLFLSWWKPSTTMLGWNPGIGPVKIHLRGIWDLYRNKECSANSRESQQDPQDTPTSPVPWSQPMNGQNSLPRDLLPAQNPQYLCNASKAIAGPSLSPG